MGQVEIENFHVINDGTKFLMKVYMQLAMSYAVVSSHKHVSIVTTKVEGPQLSLVKSTGGTKLRGREFLLKVHAGNHHIVRYLHIPRFHGLFSVLTW